MDTSSGGAGEPPQPSGRSSRPPAHDRTARSSSTSSIECGRVGRGHTLDGSFHVTRPDASLLPVKGQTVVVAGVDHVVERRGGTDTKPTLKLVGVSGRDAVDALRGEGVWVDRADTPELDPDEFWAEDLIGLAVRDGEREVGVVERVTQLPSCEVLVVGTLLIPLIGDAVRTVDVAAGVVDVDLAFLGEAGP